MASRCYLFVSDVHPDNDPQGSSLTGLSEWSGCVPLSHQLLVSTDCQLCQSRIWKSEYPLALVGELQPGIERFLTFLEDLDVDRFEEAKQTALDYFSSLDQTPRYVILEPTEIFHLQSVDPEDACKDLHASIIQPQLLEKQVFKALRELNSRSLLPSPGWYPDYEFQLYLLGLTYWTDTLYFDFNNS